MRVDLLQTNSVNSIEGVLLTFLSSLTEYFQRPVLYIEFAVFYLGSTFF